MMTNKAYDVVVIGAGVIGTSTAYHLVKKGLSVALVDRSDVARGTSSHCDAMAMLTDKQPAQTQPWVMQVFCGSWSCRRSSPMILSAIRKVASMYARTIPSWSWQPIM